MKNWAQTMKRNANVTVLTQKNEGVIRYAAKTAWHPLQAWMSWIDQPRGTASNPAPARTSSGSPDFRDSLGSEL